MESSSKAFIRHVVKGKIQRKLTKRHTVARLEGVFKIHVHTKTGILNQYDRD